MPKHTHTHVYTTVAAQPPQLALTASLIAIAAIALGLTLIPACTPKKQVKQPPPTPPAPTFTGPTVLRGTIGSLTTLRNYRPQFVAGYGLVVGLRGTGSSEVPAFLRQWMINTMKKGGLGSARLDTTALSPERVLADTNTAVVRIIGFIPPGAVRNTRFDLLVEAADTQTTSLAGGKLWTAELSPEGLDIATTFSKPLAEARGAVYIDPIQPGSESETDQDPNDTMQLYRRATILAGGRTLEPARIELILNQPSWARSRAIADRINERFPAEPGARFPTADAKTDLVIRLHIPQRYAAKPGEMISLIQHLFLNRHREFAPMKTTQLLETLKTQPELRDSIVLALQTLGKTIIPQLREHYGSEDTFFALAALEAGARLGDEHATRYLLDLSAHEDAQVRLSVAKALVHLPRSQRGAVALQQLVDDEDSAVRLAAYETLATNDDPLLNRIAVPDANGRLKFVIDRVPAKKPMVYISQTSVPRLVVFDPVLGFDTPMLARLWSGRFMLRQNQKDQPLHVFYQPPGTPTPKTYKVMPTVATLAYMMAHHPTLDQPQDGLDMTYGDVVNIVHELCRKGHIDAPLQFDESPLARIIREQRQRTEQPQVRPETSDDTPTNQPGDATSGGTDAGNDAPPAVSPEVTPDAEPETGTEAGPENGPETVPNLPVRPETGNRPTDMSPNPGQSSTSTR